MVVYQTSISEGLYQYDGASWSIVGGSGGGGSSAEHLIGLGWINVALSTRWTFQSPVFQEVRDLLNT